MMLKRLRRSLESEKKDKDIFDIVIYGSAVKGKIQPRDIDVLVIFLRGNLKERLDKVQNIKSKLKEYNLDIKQAKIEDLFSSGFFARTGIIIEGISVFREKSFAEILGFKPYTLFWYNLKRFTHNQKIKFDYVLAGRGGTKGIIREFKGERLVNGAIKIPIAMSDEFEGILKANNVDYKKKDILEAD